MTEDEFEANGIIGYGIFPCLILSAIVTGFIAEWSNAKYDMQFGLLLILIIVFGTLCSFWIWLVKTIIVFKNRNKTK